MEQKQTMAKGIAALIYILGRVHIVFEIFRRGSFSWGILSWVSDWQAYWLDS